MTHHLLKSSPPDTITLGVKSPTYEFGCMDMNIQTTTVLFGVKHHLDVTMKMFLDGIDI